ncbi:hypothetical protein VKT23_003878 [Stygiomarasmius scandens]|uniref:FLZ-type domain-containing protein n=1 Tax=Marasmiellus scandens TaxID=2682957 RepID=A0ABR1JZ97_9AGAR
MDFDTQWCPVCDKQILPQKTLIPVLPIRKRGGIVEGTGRAPPKMRTVIDQGPYPLYCSDQCKLHDLDNRQKDDQYPFVYPLFSSKSDSSPSDIESVSSSDASLSPSSEHSQPRFLSTSPESPTYSRLSNEQRSKSFHHNSSAPKQSASARFPSSLPTHTDELLDKFSLSFSRRSESRVSLYGSPVADSMLNGSPPRRERPLLPSGAAGKLLVPDVLVRVPSSANVSRPANSRRPSSSSLSSNLSSRSRTGSSNSFKSPLSRYADVDALDEEAIDDAPLSPTFDAFSSIAPRRPVVEARSWSYDNFTIKKPSTARQDTAPKRQSYNPEGKRLFLFPTD